SHGSVRCGGWGSAVLSSCWGTSAGSWPVGSSDMVEQPSWGVCTGRAPAPGGRRLLSGLGQGAPKRRTRRTRSGHVSGGLPVDALPLTHVFGRLPLLTAEHRHRPAGAVVMRPEPHRVLGVDGAPQREQSTEITGTGGGVARPPPGLRVGVGRVDHRVPRRVLHEFFRDTSG